MRSGYDRIGREVPVEVAQKSCLDKRLYKTRNEARDKASHIAKTHPDYAPQVSYKCTICGGFHLTTRPKESASGIRNIQKHYK